MEEIKDMQIPENEIEARTVMGRKLRLWLVTPSEEHMHLYFMVPGAETPLAATRMVAARFKSTGRHLMPKAWQVRAPKDDGAVDVSNEYRDDCHDSIMDMFSVDHVEVRL